MRITGHCPLPECASVRTGNNLRGHDRKPSHLLGPRHKTAVPNVWNNEVGTNPGRRSAATALVAAANSRTTRGRVQTSAAIVGQVPRGTGDVASTADPNTAATHQHPTVSRSDSQRSTTNFIRTFAPCSRDFHSTDKLAHPTRYSTNYSAAHSTDQFAAVQHDNTTAISASPPPSAANIRSSATRRSASSRCVVKPVTATFAARSPTALVTAGPRANGGNPLRTSNQASPCYDPTRSMATNILQVQILVPAPLQGEARVQETGRASFRPKRLR